MRRALDVVIEELARAGSGPQAPLSAPTGPASPTPPTPGATCAPGPERRTQGRVRRSHRRRTRDRKKSVVDPNLAGRRDVSLC